MVAQGRKCKIAGGNEVPGADVFHVKQVVTKAIV